MRRLWAVARQTFIEVMRGRVTTLFLFALTGLILLTPFVASGGSLRDHIQTFLVYSIALSGVLISVMTVLLGCGLICGEIENRNIFAPITKPVSRWQYLLGRWLGLVMLQGMLIGIYGSAIYATAYVIRYQSGDARSRWVVDTEVFCARERHPSPASVAKDPYALIRKKVNDAARSKLADLRKQGRYAEAVEKSGVRSVAAAIEGQAAEKLQTVPFFGMLQWRFTGLTRPTGENAAIQFRFKARAKPSPPDDTLRGLWRFESTSGATYYLPNPRLRSADFPTKIETTFTVPAEVIGEDGVMIVTFHNADPVRLRKAFRTSITIAAKDVYVLYPVGSFAPNFLRAMLLVLCLQVFLAALTLLAGTWLSFPVACLGCFVVFILGMMSSFLTESTVLRGDVDLWTRLAHHVWGVVRQILPDFAVISPTDSLVDGLVIPWMRVLHAAGTFVGVWTVLALAIASVIFTLRELARVIAE